MNHPRLKTLGLLLLFGPLLGTLIHEAGHLLLIALSDTSIISIVLFGKFQLYPSVAIVPSMGAGFMIDSYFPDFDSRGWVSLGGIMVTIPVSMGGLLLYRQKPTLIRLIFSCYILDALTYTLLPTIGLRRWIVFGPLKESGLPFSEVTTAFQLLDWPFAPSFLLIVGYCFLHLACLAILRRRRRIASSIRVGASDKNSSGTNSSN